MMQDADCTIGPPEVSYVEISGVCRFNLTDGSIEFDERFKDNPTEAARAFIAVLEDKGWLHGRVLTSTPNQ